MAELLGEHHYQMDPKGRISLPTKFRDAFPDGVYLTLGQDGCLFAFPHEEWERRQNEAKGFPISGDRSRVYTRMFFSNAEIVDLDGQGRLVVPRSLRESARLEREVTVVGVSERLEIWAREEWERYRDTYRAAYLSGSLVPES